MKIQHKIDSLANKRNFSSTEIKKLQTKIIKPKIMKDCKEGFSIAGPTIQKLKQMQGEFFIKDKTLNLIQPLKSLNKLKTDETIQYQLDHHFIEVVKIKPREKERKKVESQIKPPFQGIEASNEQAQKSPRKRKIIKKIVQEKLITLPKLSYASTMQENKNLNRPLLSNLDINTRKISCQHYHILEHETQQNIISYRSKSKIEVASLTKILTFYTVIRISEQKGINISKTKVTVDEDAEQICGTSAYLQEGQMYTIEQLLYGLMLPSGNDAALCLAKWGGNLIREEKEPKIKKFVERMNKEARKLQLRDTRFGNPHGLPSRESQTTCEDMARLCSICLKIPIFVTIVGTQCYQTKVQHQNLKKKSLVQWENTNKLLRRPGFIGIKTGITITAGPCLASAYQFQNKTYIVIIAKSCKPSRRFKQTRKILMHCLQKLNISNLTKEEKKTLKKLGKDDQQLDSDYSDDEKQFDFKKSDNNEMSRRLRIVTQH